LKMHAKSTFRKTPTTVEHAVEIAVPTLNAMEECVDVNLDSKTAMKTVKTDAKSISEKTTTTADHAPMCVAPTLNVLKDRASANLDSETATKTQEMDVKSVFKTTTTVGSAETGANLILNALKDSVSVHLD